jgi:hypothetical protein
MQPRHELVEVLGQLTHLILAVGVDVNCEIPLAVGDVVQGVSHPIEIGEQVFEGGSEQGTEHQQHHAKTGGQQLAAQREGHDDESLLLCQAGKTLMY